jgi:hypothetical protein
MGFNIKSLKNILPTIGKPKKTVKVEPQTIQETAKQVEIQATNIGRDLVKTVHSPKVSYLELMKQGYSAGADNIYYKVDKKTSVYKGFRFEKDGLKNITLQNTNEITKSCTTELLSNGEWASVNTVNKSFNLLKDTSERAAQKATELQFNGYVITGQDEKALSLAKEADNITILKSTGDELK